jgi:outer membrane lipase/esterase
VGSGQGAQITALSSFFNTTLFGALDATGVPTMRVNAFALLNEVLANPAAYGFLNTSTPACGTTASLVCTSANFVTPTAAQTFLFADGVHPTTAGHALIAQAVESMITGPQQIASLAEAPLSVEQANFRALDNRMWSSLNAPRSQAKLEAWVAYDYSHTDQQAGPNNGSAHMNTIAVGGDMKVSDRTLVGAMFGYTDNKGDFAGAGGGYTLRQPVGTVYAGYGDGPWYVGATLGAGSLDYSDITSRHPAWRGVAHRERRRPVATSSPGGSSGGYWFPMKDLMHGPYARLAWEKAVVKQFSETELGQHGVDLLTGRTRKQAAVEPRLAGAGNIGAIRPYARATWEIDSKDQDRSVGASSVTLGGNYSIPVAKPDNSYALFSVGASTEFGSVTGFVAGSAYREPGGWQLLGGHRRPPGAPVAPGTSDRASSGGGPLNRIAAACAARARTAGRKAGAAAFAARTRRSPWATAAHRIACGDRSRARSGARPRPHSARTAWGRDFSPSWAC